MSETTKKPCGGCGGNIQRAKSALRSQQADGQPAATPRPPARRLMVVVVGVGKESVELIGNKTGRSYGWVRNGVVFPMDLADYEGDKRVTRATQDTLRMFT